MKVILHGTLFGSTCADPGIFIRGGPGQSDKKSSDNIVFLVLSLFYQSQMVNFNEIYISFFKAPEGVQHLPGGGGGGGRGVQLLIPYRNPYNL